MSASRVAFLLVTPVIFYLQTLRRFASYAAFTGCAPVMPFSDAPSAVIQISVAQNLV
jgi:low affinity Fe/Cu permease